MRRLPMLASLALTGAALAAGTAAALVPGRPAQAQEQYQRLRGPMTPEAQPQQRRAEPPALPGTAGRPSAPPIPAEAGQISAPTRRCSTPSTGATWPPRAMPWRVAPTSARATCWA
ncbi:hypothetical protein [Teichococcus aestuarii]|uniref:hypothetical protein n=1 Tax=Teichococcus aestuarii TaxID=568898 RepID=UPI00360D3D40